MRMPERRRDQGELPGALVIDHTVLPWRLDPTFDWRIPEATSWGQRWILVCRHGYSSSLAARNLRQLGLVHATDVIGGFEAWRTEACPWVKAPPTCGPDERSTRTATH